AVPDTNAAALRSREARAHDVGTHEDLLVAEPIGNQREVGRRIGNEHEFCLTAVDHVAEPPAAHRPSAALRGTAAEAAVTLPARRDRADDHALTDLISRDGLAEFLDH